MKIKIEYLLKGEIKWKKKYLTIEEYFDPLDEEDIKEGFDVNSMSRHFFKPYLYVVNTINEILYLNIIIEQNKEKLVEKMIYLDDVFYFREVIKYKNNKIEHKQLNIMTQFNIPLRMESSFVLTEVDGVYYPLIATIKPDYDSGTKYDSIDFSDFKFKKQKNNNI